MSEDPAVKKGSREWLDSPPQQAMTVAEWQRRLELTFYDHGASLG